MPLIRGLWSVQCLVIIFFTIIKLIDIIVNNEHLACMSDFLLFDVIGSWAWGTSSPLNFFFLVCPPTNKQQLE